MAWYLGVDYNIPECSAVKCPDGECERLKAERHNITTAYVQPLEDEQRDSVRRDHLSMGQYSFFSSDDYDRLGKKVPTISFDYLKNCLKKLNGEEETDDSGENSKQEDNTDENAELSLDEYLKNHKVAVSKETEADTASEETDKVKEESLEMSEDSTDENQSINADNIADTNNIDTSSVVIYTLDDEDELVDIIDEAETNIDTDE